MGIKYLKFLINIINYIFQRLRQIIHYNKIGVVL